ncbi:MAG: LysR family transcriptional regulator [Solobacterium sp.]|nr:LysR family transcriptional regulator [Solobacterium sp.]
MDLRVLSYFLAVAREESFSGAAAAIHISQPTLSRQIADLEEELGRKLFVRGSRGLVLTAEGQQLKKRALELLSLAEKTEEEIRGGMEGISGSISIGAGETYGIHTVTRAFRKLQGSHPGLSLHISSGDGRDLAWQLDNGLIDLAVVFGEVDHSHYECITLPYRDRMGVYLRKDDPLADKKQIFPKKDLIDKPIIINRESSGDLIPGVSLHLFRIAGTYNLLYNASLMAEDGLGCVVGLEHIINTEGTDLVFIPFAPEYRLNMYLIYKKYQVIPRHIALLIDEIRKTAD